MGTVVQEVGNASFPCFLQNGDRGRIKIYHDKVRAGVIGAVLRHSTSCRDTESLFINKMHSPPVDSTDYMSWNQKQI